MIFSLMYETRRSILGIVTLDVMVQEELDLPSEVTQYPIEDGGPDVSDHITQGNESLNISGSVSHANSEAFELGATTSKLIDVLEAFRDMHADRIPIRVVTGLGVYEDMGFNGITLTRTNQADKGGNWLEIKAKLVKVIKVQLETAELPPEKVATKAKGKAGGTEKKGGKKGDKEPSKPVMRSSLKSGKNAVTGSESYQNIAQKYFGS